MVRISSQGVVPLYGRQQILHQLQNVDYPHTDYWKDFQKPKLQIAKFLKIDELRDF